MKRWQREAAARLDAWAGAASPRLALFSHAEGGAAVVERTRRTYPGRVEFGEDLMVIEIGDEVVVRRRGTNALR
jgi:hypothetical protein